jgi:ribosomal protein S18 acetylase RimI-like enzyme
MSFVQATLMVLQLSGEKNAAGLLTYRIEGPDCEIVTLDSTADGEGIGSSLIDAVKGRAEAKGCRRLWLITTNDNLRALGFYQRRGFRLIALYPNALEASKAEASDLHEGIERYPDQG